ncbi:hypothetical protein FACS189487_00840 [Campylobacterota bacterium]|nr:hypothetical protein FACS189487_00840 [Campylobacterota bacterium]
MFGLSNHMKEFTMSKISKQIGFIETSDILVHGVKHICLKDIVMSPIYNANRYVAEIMARVNALNDYAKHRDLVPVMLTLTLPSEYHPTVTRKSKKSGQIYTMKNNKYINDDDHKPKSACKELSRLFDLLKQKQDIRRIPKDDRVYFRVIEPHKSGVPHCHILYFVPLKFRDGLVRAFEELYPAPLGKVEVDIKNAVGYLLKYCLKTLDDLRDGGEITDLSLWYIYHGICRFYTSHTLVNLSAYRKAAGAFDLLDMTYEYRKDCLKLFLDSSKSIYTILDENVVYYIKCSDIRPSWADIKNRAEHIKAPVRKKPYKIPVVSAYGKLIGYCINGKLVDASRRPLRKMSLLSLIEHKQILLDELSIVLGSSALDYKPIFQRFALLIRELVSRFGYKYDVSTLSTELDKQGVRDWLRREDLNLRPPGYEPDELPDCSTPRHI